MEDKIDKAIEKMAELALTVQNDGTKAQQYSQAAYNFAQAKQTLISLEGKSTKSKGAGA